MARPIMLIELSDDENSIFIYRCDEQTEVLEATIGLQREDVAFQVSEYVRAAVTEHAQVIQTR